MAICMLTINISNKLTVIQSHWEKSISCLELSHVNLEGRFTQREDRSKKNVFRKFFILAQNISLKFKKHFF